MNEVGDLFSAGVYGVLEYCLAIFVLPYGAFHISRSALGWNRPDSVVAAFLVGLIACRTVSGRPQHSESAYHMLHFAFHLVALMFLPWIFTVSSYRILSELFPHSSGWLIAVIPGLIGLVSFGILEGRLRNRKPTDKIMRGIGMPETRTTGFAISPSLLKRLSFFGGRNAQTEVGGIPFGADRLPDRLATSHFAFIGQSGAGKTKLLIMFLTYALSLVGKRSDTRALIYDGKNELLRILAGHKRTGKIVSEIYSLNPFFSDGKTWKAAAWDMAADIKDKTTAMEVGAIFFPPDPNIKDPFWMQASSQISGGVIYSFILRGEKWGFDTFVRAMESETSIKKALLSHPRTRHFAETYLNNSHFSPAILASIASKMNGFHALAALWSRASVKVSLTDWAGREGTDNYTLVLGTSKRAKTQLDALNRVIFHMLQQILTDQPDSETRRTWIVADEIRLAGRLTGLEDFCLLARSKGGSIAMAFQDIEGLRSEYGVYITNEILGLMTNKAILRLNNPETAKWAESLFGPYEAIETRITYSEGTGGGGVSSGMSQAEQYATRARVLSTEFMELPYPNPKVGLHGYFITAEGKAYKNVYTGEYIARHVFKPEAEDLVIPLRPGSEQEFDDETTNAAVPPETPPTLKPEVEVTPDKPKKRKRVLDNVTGNQAREQDRGIL